MRQYLKTRHPDIDVHGFRSTLRDWLGEETHCPNHVAEMILSHVVKGVEGDYRRKDLLKKRVEFMDTWAAFLAG